LSSEHRPAATPENESDPEAFREFFWTVVDGFQWSRVTGLLQNKDDTALQHHLGKLEESRAQVWEPETYRERDSVASLLVASTVSAFVQATIEATNWRHRDKLLEKAGRLLCDLQDIVSDLNDDLIHALPAFDSERDHPLGKDPDDAIQFLAEWLDANWADPKYLRRRNRISEATGAGLRERIMVQLMGPGIKQLLGDECTAVVVAVVGALASAATGMPISTPQSQRWLRDLYRFRNKPT